ncbi:MAG: calcium-binding protein [Actinomycetota bacterium]
MSRGLFRRQIGPCALAGATALSALALAVPAPAGAKISCEYQSLGAAGASGNRLQVTATSSTDQTELKTNGTDIKVADLNKGAVDCDGGVRPRITNVDEIHITVAGSLAISRMDGEFAPGVENEPGAGDEIEMFAAGAGGVLTLVGYQGRDEFQLRGGSGDSSPRDHANLNAAQENVDDFDDLEFKGFAKVAVDAKSGNDKVINDATSPYADPLTLVGGGGRDLLLAGPAADRLLGGSGDDVLRGRGGGDRLVGEGGLDTLGGGAGNDVLRSSADGKRDNLLCGPGRDKAVADGFDIRSDCERPKPNHD